MVNKTNLKVQFSENCRSVVTAKIKFGFINQALITNIIFAPSATPIILG